MTLLSFLEDLDLSILPQVALLIFFGAFVALSILAIFLPRLVDVDEVARLPLGGDDHNQPCDSDEDVR